MLLESQIRSLAIQFQTSEQNVATEYCQHLFLSNLYNIKNSSKLLFKGGTALRIIFNSSRFSEDLDFSGENLSARDIESVLLDCLDNISYSGIETDIKESKKTSGGYLSQLNFRWNSYDVNIRVEISLRTKKMDKEVFMIASDYLSPYSVSALSTSSLVQEKIRATLERKKPRDFFDVYFLLRSRLVPPEQKSLLQKVEKTIRSENINFSRELKQFLPVSMHPVIKNFQDSFLAELKRNIG